MSAGEIKNSESMAIGGGGRRRRACLCRMTTVPLRWARLLFFFSFSSHFRFCVSVSRVFCRPLLQQTSLSARIGSTVRNTAGRIRYFRATSHVVRTHRPANGMIVTSYRIRRPEIKSLWPDVRSIIIPYESLT